MTDTGPADFIIVFYIVASCPLIETFVKLGTFDVLGRLEVVGRYNNLFPVEHLIHSLLS
ncbi:hypothetical protein ES703_72600 [subsurface metagenome]